MKTKIKLMALVAGLLSILPTTSAWATSDTTYYASLKAIVSNGSTGAGKVYAGTSNKAETYASSSTSGNQSSTTQNDVKTFYAFAQAEKGFEFTGWSDSDGGAVNNTENPRTVTVKCSSSSESSPTTTTVWANFKKKLLDAFGIAFETSDAGIYTVDGGNPVDKTGLTEVTSVNLASADPNFLNWTVNGAAISDNPYTATCLADTTIGAVFLTPDQVAEATTYDELTAALANDGKKKITIPAGASCVIPAGTTFTVSTGKKLVVDGTLMVIGSIVNNGTIAGSGVIAYNAKTITQAAKVNVPYPAGTDGPVGTASGLVACDKDHKAEEVSSAGKYLNTSVADGVKALSDLSVKTKYFATVVNKASGETFMSSLLDSVPVAVVCTVARDKALNWISGMSGDTSAYADVKTALGKAQTGTVGGVANFNDDCNRLAVLLMNGSADYSSTANSSSDFSTIVDLANCSLTVTSSSKNKQFNRHAIVRAFNGSISLSQKVMSTKFFLYNCTGSLGYLSGGNQYGTAAYLYDSPNYSVTFKDLVTDSPAGSLNFCGGGPYTTTKVKFQTTPTTKFNVVYAGTFVSSMDPRKYLWDDNKVEAVQDPSTKNWIVQDKYVDPNKGQTLVNGEEHSFVEAFEIAKAGDVIKLQRDVELEEDLNVASGKDVRLDLSGFALSGDFKIVNNGELEIIDCNNGVVPSQVNVPIINNGTLLLSNAAYNGDITLNKGLCYFLAGSFNGDVILAADAVADEVAQVRGGTFAKSVYKQGGGEGTLLSLCENGYTEGGKIAQIPNSYIVGPGMVKKASFSIRALLPNDEALVTRVSSYEENRNRYTKTEWINLMTVRASSSFFAAWNVDCGARVDRDVGAGDLKLGVLIVTEDIPAISVGDSASVLLPAMRDSGMASGAWGYQSILPGGENADKVEFTVQGNQVAEGTSVWMEMRLVRSLHVLTQPKDWSYSGPYVVTGSRRFVVGAEANKAMVWGEEGGATFYSTLDMAVAADATTGKTIKLCNDCDEKVTVSKVCTIDTNGFAFNGEITAGDCYAVTATDLGDGKTQYEVKLSKVTVGIPAVANTTLAVTASEGEVTDLGNGRYQVAPGATVTATYTPNEGYFGEKIVKTIASAAEGATVTVSSGEAASVKAIVAKIGETPYASLADAVEVAAESGATIDVVKESTLTVVEDVELTVKSGKLVAAIPEDGVLELKDGTDVTLAWPEGECAADHIIVTGGRYSADPSAFLADGLEAKEKDGKYVVGVKVVIVIDEEQEATEENTAEKTVMTGEQTSKVDEEKVEEVIKDVVPEEQKEKLVNNIKTNTTVEGVKLTMVDEVVIPDETKPEEKEVVKESGVKAVVLAAKTVAQETAVAAAGKTDEQKTQDEKTAEAFKAALEQKEKDVEITVKVEVKAKLVEYVPPAGEVAQEAPKGTIKFELKPEAIVTVAVENEEPVKQTVPVSNDMIDQSQKIKVSMYAGFKPVQVLHRDDNGQLIEEFTGDTIGYDEATRIVSVMITHFSSMELNEAAVDPLAPSDAIKVTDGFYQNATTYQDSTEFYITSKAGFHAFRDLINQDNGVIDAYIASGFYNSTADQFYTTNPFTGKTVKLLCDVDEEDVTVKPIGMTKHSRADEKDKRYFYGVFDGCNHKISNLRVIDDPPTTKHRVGLFGYVVRNEGTDAGVRNLTVENAYISGYNYVGGFVGGTDSGIVISNCCLKGDIHVTGVAGYVGGMLGHGSADFYDCKVLASAGSTITDGSWASGGIVGYWSASRKMYNCHAEGYTGYSPYYAVGSMAGYLEGGNVISNCTASGIVLTGKSNTPSAMGSIVGNNGCEIAAPAMVIDCRAENVTVWANNGGVQVYGQVGSEFSEGRAPIVGWDIEGKLIEGGIVGGTFESLPDSYVALGYEKVAQSTPRETWKVQEVAVVAKIGEVTYPSLQAAIDEVGEGQTIVLLADTDEQLSGGAKKFVIDCGSGRDDVENIKQFDVENFAAQEGWMLQEFDLGDYHTYYEYIKPVCKVEVSGIFDDWVTYYETLADALSYEKHNAYETIQLVADCDEDIVIDITTYGLEDDKNPDLCNFTVEENGYNFTGSIVGVNGAKVTKNGTTWTIEPGYVAEIEGEWTTVKYLSLASAVAAAEDGDTVKLLSDAEETERLVVGKDAAIIIDLGGKTLTSSADVAVWLGEGSDLTIANGSLIAQNNGIYPNGENATATIAKDAYVEAGQWVMHSNGKAHTTFNVYGTAYCEWYPTIQLHSEDSTVNLDGANVRSFDYYAVYVNGSFCGDTVNIKDSTILSDQYLGVYVSNQYGRPFQTLNISGNTTITGLTAVEVKHANVTIGEGVKLIATDEPSFDEWDSGECTFGWSFATTRNGETDKPTGTITVTGGEFTGPFGIPSEIEETDEVSVAVTGGTFDYDPSEYVADGYEAVPQGTTPETWVVQKAKTYVAAVVSADGTVTTKYETLAAAVAAAQAGETIEMLCDATENTSIAIEKSLTIDLAGTTLTFAQYGNRIGDDAVVTFKDGDIAFAKGGTAPTSYKGAFYVRGELTLDTVGIAIENCADYGIDALFHLHASNEGEDDARLVTLNINDSDIKLIGTAEKPSINDVIQGYTQNGGAAEVRVNLTNTKVKSSYCGYFAQYVEQLTLDGSTVTVDHEQEIVANSSGVFTLVNGSSIAVDTCASHALTGLALVVNNGCTVDVKNAAYLGLNVNKNSAFKSGSMVSVSNCCMKTDNEAYAGKDIAIRSNGKLTIEAGAEIVCYGVATTVDGASINIAGGKFKEVRAGGTGTITLTGGIYSTEPTESYVATGYVVANNQDDATKAAYPWKVQEPTVTTEEAAPIIVDISKASGEPSAEEVKVPVTVTQELAKEILGATTDVTQPLKAEQVTEIVTQLQAAGEDGMTGWQKYTAGFSQTDKHPLAPKGKGGEDGKLVLVTSLVAPKQLSVDTGVKVKYILMKGSNVNQATGLPQTWTKEQELLTPEFPVDVTKLANETYWKIEVEYTATKKVVETEVDPAE